MDRILILQRVVDKKMIQIKAGEKLKLSERQVRRLVKRFKRLKFTNILIRFLKKRITVPHGNKNLKISFIFHFLSFFLLHDKRLI